ncbi:ABC transporter ATP-binding protein [Bifidobacterium coryneforme]|uniref:ABC transporter ATP-binding protein n=1 Tax=Bifidobacterium coryneforme TaxID=1687 RepID=UPI0023EF8424|nr:ABC transporter ATP-binding protein [Bifidobacterium coryneforme]
MRVLAKYSNVSKTIDERLVIDSVSFEVQEGSTFALLGPNGAGKTTTIRLLTGLLSPDEGEISLFGSRLSRDNASTLRSGIGVQNDGNLYEELTIEENLNLWGNLYGLKSSLMGKRIDELLSLFDLVDRRKSKISQLSKGMRQKVMVARAIIHHPRLLILDEPTTGLDPQSSETLMSYLKVLTEEEKMTVLFSTHILEGLEQLATHVGILNKGKMLASGEVPSLLEQRWPTDQYSISSDNNQRVYEICGHYGVCKYDSTRNESRVVVEPETIDMPDLINILVTEGIKISTAEKVQRTIRDYYFDILAGKSDER